MTPASPRLVISAFGATLVLSACQDTTAPSREPAPGPAAVAARAPVTRELGAMKALGANFGDATDPFVGVVADMKAQRALRVALLSLSDHLAAGEVEAAADDIKAARTILAELDGMAVEMAPITLALDNAELALKGETPGGEPAPAPTP